MKNLLKNTKIIQFLNVLNFVTNKSLLGVRISYCVAIAIFRGSEGVRIKKKDKNMIFKEGY